MSQRLQCLYVPLNESQKILRSQWDTGRVFILHGPAGSGKTHAAMGEAMTDLVTRGRRLMLARPLVSLDEDVGFLPGSLDEKLTPWLGAFRDVSDQLSHESLTRWVAEGRIELVQIGMLRGRTVRQGTLLVDEAQNCTLSQLRCILTRVGRGGRVVLCGDPYQSDLPHGDTLADVAARLHDVREVVTIEFSAEDQMRDPLITKILRRV